MQLEKGFSNTSNYYQFSTDKTTRRNHRVTTSSLEARFKIKDHHKRCTASYSGSRTTDTSLDHALLTAIHK